MNRDKTGKILSFYIQDPASKDIHEYQFFTDFVPVLKMSCRSSRRGAVVNEFNQKP